MLFNSFEFIFFFMPTTLLFFSISAYYFGKRGALAILLLSSLFFYGWWNPSYLILLVISVLGNYFIALLIAHIYQRNQAWACHIRSLGIAANLGLIIWYKYAGLLATSLTALTSTTFDFGTILLPLGISFFTFQQISYLSSVAINGQAERDPLRYSVFICFFAHLIAGPLVQPREILPQLDNIRTRLVSWNIVMGGTLFIIGLSKKTLLADTFAIFVSPVFIAAKADQPIGMIDAWGAMLSYTMQIYFDFSAYSEMAMGLALLFGLRFPVNFASPYKAVSIIDFWRRWHMTLSAFLRDFLYIPLGGRRRGERRRYINLMATMVVGGLWHGANWTFVAWGTLHGLYLVVNHLWVSHGPVRKLPKWLAWGITFSAVVLAWVPFRAENFATAQIIYQGLFGITGIAPPEELMKFIGIWSNTSHEQIVHSVYSVQQFVWMVTSIGIGLAITLLSPSAIEIFRSAAVPEHGKTETSLTWHATISWAISIGGLAALSMMQLSSPSEFIYFNF